MFKEYREEIFLFAGIIAVGGLLTDQDGLALIAGVVAALNYVCHKVGV